MASNLSSVLMIYAFLISGVVCQEKLLSIISAETTIDTDSKSIASKMCWKIYTGRSIKSAEVLDIAIEDVQALYDNLDTDKPLVLHMHGYTEYPSDESVQTVVAAHLERGTDNTVVLDWSELSSESYVILVGGKIHDIAKILARSVDRLVELGFDLEKIHLVSHSLGSHLAGFVGKYSKNSIPRITGLDPANPGFYHPGAEHIDAKCARFVDIIHTDGGFLGAGQSTGSVDLFANGGSRPQPGCSVLSVPSTKDDLCHHERSWRYYAESVLNEHAFEAFNCNSEKKFFSGGCTSHRHVYVGYATPPDAKGSFYFTTNAKSPYGQNSSSDTGNQLEE